MKLTESKHPLFDKIPPFHNLSALYDPKEVVEVLLMEEVEEDYLIDQVE